MSNEAPTDALRLVNPHKDITENLRQAAVDLHPWFVGDAKTFSVDCALPAYLNDAADEIERLRAAAPASPLPGGGPYERWSILNHLGESWTPENFDTERQATAFLDRWKRDNPKMDLSKHKVIPVLVTMTAAPTGEPK